jgi:general secretion pathway protein J
MKHERGFTLIEILIALFIFTIVSFLLMSSLRTIITAQSRTEEKALRLRDVQMAFLFMSRDIEQALNRPILNASGKEDAAFIGKEKTFQLTHTGFANPLGVVRRSNLQRTIYTCNENVVERQVFPVLDQAPETKADVRTLLTNVTEARFQYLDHHGHLADKWPINNGEDQPLPRGVKISLTLARWGNISQVYLIPVKKSD